MPLQGLVTESSNMICRQLEYMPKCLVLFWRLFLLSRTLEVPALLRDRINYELTSNQSYIHVISCHHAFAQRFFDLKSRFTNMSKYFSLRNYLSP